MNRDLSYTKEKLDGSVFAQLLERLNKVRALSWYLNRRQRESAIDLTAKAEMGIALDHAKNLFDEYCKEVERSLK